MGEREGEESQAVSNHLPRTGAEEPARGAQARGRGDMGERGPAMDLVAPNTAAGQKRAAVPTGKRETGK